MKNIMVREEWHTLMVIYTKENGKTEKLMGMVYLLIPTEACLRETGSKINNMDKVPNPGISIRLNIPETLLMVRKQAMAALNLKEDSMKANSLTESFMDLVNIILPIQESYMKVNLKIIIWTVKVWWYGQINHVTKENLKMAKLKVKERKIMLMATDT